MIDKMVKRIFHRNWGKKGFIRDKRREAEEDAAEKHDTGFAASPEKEEDGEKPVSARCCSCFLISQGHHSKSHKKGNTSDLKNAAHSTGLQFIHASDPFTGSRYRILFHFFFLEEAQQ